MTNTCYLCSGNTETSYILQDIPSAAQVFRNSSAGALEEKLDFEVFQCDDCGLVQFPGSLVPYYREVIRSSNLSLPMMNFRREQFANLIREMPDKSGSVFELGAGRGEYLDIFMELGCVTYGVEGSASLAQLGQKSGHQIEETFLNEGTSMKIPQTGYDAAVSFNFIEHLPDPKSTLKTVLNMVKDNGIALFEVPNFDMISNYHLFNEFIPDHRFYFTKKSFSLLLELTGFEVVELKSIWDDYIISATARRRPKYQWTEFETRRLNMKNEIVSFFSNTEITKNAIWSAGHQSLATISNLGLKEYVAYIIDSSPAKQEMFGPGSGIKIISPGKINGSPISTIMVAAAGFNEEIVEFIKTNCRPDIKLSILDKGTVRAI